MDEFGSPISGSIRSVRRSISSSFLRGGQRTPQVDPVTTNLLQQQSLQLTTVSDQLKNISQQLSLINFNIKAVKDNISLNEQLEKQREDAKRNRERILAEQGLREGKESELEKKIQASLFSPVARIGQKTRGVLQKLTSFLLTLAGGWLTINGINLLKTMSEGNVDKINIFKTKFLGGLALSVGAITAITIGVKKAMAVLGVFSSNLSRIAFGGIMKSSLLGIRLLFSGLIAKGIQLAANMSKNGRPRNIVDNIVDGASFLGPLFIFKALENVIGKQANKLLDIKLPGGGSKPGGGGRTPRKVFKKFGENVKQNVKPLTDMIPKPVRKNFKKVIKGGVLMNLLFAGASIAETKDEIAQLDKDVEAGNIDEQVARREKFGVVGGRVLGFLTGISVAGIIAPEGISSIIGTLLLGSIATLTGQSFGDLLGKGIADLTEKNDDKKIINEQPNVDEDGVLRMTIFGERNSNLIDTINENDKLSSISNFREDEQIEVVTVNSNSQNNSSIINDVDDGKRGTGSFPPKIPFIKNSKMFYTEALIGAQQ